jgi:hypothetical protein
MCIQAQVTPQAQVHGTSLLPISVGPIRVPLAKGDLLCKRGFAWNKCPSLCKRRHNSI